MPWTLNWSDSSERGDEIQRQAARELQAGEGRDRCRQAGEIELDRPAERLGRREEIRRIGEPGPRQRSAERLETTRSAAAQVEDRLEDRLERPRGGDLGHEGRATGVGSLAAR